jgi:peptide/nickel transport system permease protein
MLDNLGQDMCELPRQGRGKAFVVMRHVLRNSMIPVVTVIALGIRRSLAGLSSPSSVQSERCY